MNLFEWQNTFYQNQPRSTLSIQLHHAMNRDPQESGLSAGLNGWRCYTLVISCLHVHVLYMTRLGPNVCHDFYWPRLVTRELQHLQIFVSSHTSHSLLILSLINCISWHQMKNSWRQLLVLMFLCPWLLNAKMNNIGWISSMQAGSFLRKAT